MKIKYTNILLLLLVVVSIANAADTSFAVSITDIVGERGKMISDNKVLDIGNCNAPIEPQNTLIVLKMSYPSRCSGQVDVYYSYYDFSVGEYTKEELACSISGNEYCKVSFNIWFGGKGSGTEKLDKWAIFRAVCRKSQEEYTYTIPLTIVHTETEFEKKLMPKINDAEKSINNVKASLAKCNCCTEKEIAMVRECENTFNSLKLRTAQCDLRNIENQFFDVKKMADNANLIISTIKCESESKEEKKESEDISESFYEINVDKISPPKDENTKTSDIQTGGLKACPLALILLVFVGIIAFVKNNTQ